MSEQIRTHKEPFLRVIKKRELTPRQSFALKMVSLLLALIAGGISLRSSDTIRSSSTQRSYPAHSAANSRSREPSNS